MVRLVGRKARQRRAFLLRLDCSDFRLPPGTRQVEDGILLRNDSAGPGDSVIHRDYLWRGADAPPVAQTDSPWYTSPDGRFSVRVAGGSLAVASKGGGDAREFRARTEADRSAIADLGFGWVKFVGAHSLVFLSDETYVLDLETLKLRTLCLRKGSTFHESTTDGSRALFVTDDAQHGLLATVR